MNSPPEMRTAPRPASGGGCNEVLRKAPSFYLGKALAAMAEVASDPRIEALARLVEPVRGELPPRILSLIDALDGLDAVAADEREGVAE